MFDPVHCEHGNEFNTLHLTVFQLLTFVQWHAWFCAGKLCDGDCLGHGKGHTNQAPPTQVMN